MCPAIGDYALKVAGATLSLDGVFLHGCSESTGVRRNIWRLRAPHVLSPTINFDAVEYPRLCALGSVECDCAIRNGERAWFHGRDRFQPVAGQLSQTATPGTAACSQKANAGFEPGRCAILDHSW